ncbi:hypothetical protein IMZ29_04235 [Achromobacter sp. GG226]|uniref:hypothetical protein n=1 Tax=Verticiella alkaliphila TaxID=2779529 RepID=UPI001C0AA494|nr:hypothetical protein [Verticiella sp. GG226]MBU4609782.1 hypothetical protein [Verticiella sp. GG226]
MLSNDTMNALADMVAAEPDLAKQVAAIKDQYEARELLMRMAAVLGITWAEEPLRHALSDEQLQGVSGASSEAEREAKRQMRATQIAECQKVFYLFPGICTVGEEAINRLGWRG